MIYIDDPYTQQELKELSESLKDVLSQFLGQKISPTTRYTIRDHVMNLIQQHVQAGNIEPEKTPLVDVNNELEIAHLKQKIAEFQEYFNDVSEEEQYVINNTITNLNWKINSLTRDPNDDPSKFDISFKDPVTFENVGLTYLNSYRKQ